MGQVVVSEKLSASAYADGAAWPDGIVHTFQGWGHRQGGYPRLGGGQGRRHSAPRTPHGVAGYPWAWHPVAASGTRLRVMAIQLGSAGWQHPQAGSCLPVLVKTGEFERGYELAPSIDLAWDATRLGRDALHELVGKHTKLTIVDRPPYDQFAHVVDRQIKRCDVLVLRNEAGG